MALVKCKECGKEISKKAKKCPHCGAPVKRTSILTWLVAIIFGLWLIGFIASNDTTTPRSTTSSVASSTSSPQKKVSTPSMPPQCIAGSVKTGKKYNVVGSGINVRSGPGTNHDKIINQKATSILKKTQYITIDDSTIVFEECTNGEWSYIRVLEPDWLRDSHRGWVHGKFLDKGQLPPSADKYERKISSYALSPYTKQGYPKTIAKYGSRLSEIEKFRRKAAEMAIDSGKCDFVEMVELSDKKSSLKHLHFWVDCRNKQRIYLDEFQIAGKGQVLTEEDKSWTKESAIAACQQAIKDRALIPSEVDIHTILGTTFYKAPTTHNVVLNMSFDAKNALGVELPYMATCHFEPGEVGTIDIKRR